jgi:flavin reductase (DIM6/NTAB) family NADH-FMN oxidoreductase RutF
MTGAPILTDALSYVECRVARAFDCEEMTFFLGDVVAAQKLGKGLPLTAARLWTELPAEWRENYERSHDEKLVSKARKLRGLING